MFEQLSYWGATVGANIADRVPLVGSLGKQLLLAGDQYNADTLPRFFILHVAVLPGTMIVLLVMHITLIRLHGVSEPEPAADSRDEERYFNFFPDHFYTELIMGLLLMIVLSTLATLLPATMGDKGRSAHHARSHQA